MKTNAKRFIKVCALTGGRREPGSAASARQCGQRRKRNKPMNILILGGTGFTGPFQVRICAQPRTQGDGFQSRQNASRRTAGRRRAIARRSQRPARRARRNRKWDVVIDNPTSVAGLGARRRASAEGQRRALRLHFDDLGLRRQHEAESTKPRRWRNTTAPIAMKETRDTMIASEFKTLRAAEGALGTGSGKMVSRRRRSSFARA